MDGSASQLVVVTHGIFLGLALRELTGCTPQHGNAAVTHVTESAGAERYNSVRRHSSSKLYKFDYVYNWLYQRAKRF